MLQTGLNDIADEPLEARPCVGMKFDFLAARLCHGCRLALGRRRERAERPLRNHRPIGCRIHTAELRYLLACRVLGNDSTGLVVFDGMRLGDLAKRIRGMLRVQKTPNEDFSDINSCLTQLDAIGNVRQRLAHQLCEYAARRYRNAQSLHRQNG